MTRKIAFFSPDQHITYDLDTLNKRGVGGGITARVRLAHALASQGHHISLFVNCPVEKTIAGVDYHHWEKLKDIDADVCVVSTSGGAMDLSYLKNVELRVRLKILFVHGIPQPRGLESYPYDYIYAPSNFIRRTITNQWGESSSKVFVTHHGVEEKLFNFETSKRIHRDPFALIYAGHPSKGLDSAISILRLLRKKEQRFSLHVFGGYQLWGDQQPLHIDEPGLKYHGLVGQQDLVRKMWSFGFSLNLQAREEPFGLALIESMRAGCIVLASPVGAYPELICNGYNGFLVRGDHTEPSTQESAAQMILDLVKLPDYMDYVRRNAMAAPFGWDTVAKTWLGHWNWVLENRLERSDVQSRFSVGCSECAGKLLPLADGLHCTNCGRYQRYIN